MAKNDNKPVTMKIDDVEYVRKDSVADNTPAVSLDGKPYVIVRSRGAGVFAGYQHSFTPQHQEIRLANARRLWHWVGAATLSQLAMEGVSKPGQCQFPQEVSDITILEVCEVIPATEQARRSIAEVKVWRA